MAEILPLYSIFTADCTSCTCKHLLAFTVEHNHLARMLLWIQYVLWASLCGTKRQESRTISWNRHPRSGRCVVSSIPTVFNHINDVVEQPAGMLCSGLSDGYNLRILCCVLFVLNVGHRARSWVPVEGRAAGDGSEEQSSSFEIRQTSGGCGGSDSVYAPNAIARHSRHRQVRNWFV